jgi:hypothetical protein
MSKHRIALLRLAAAFALLAGIAAAPPARAQMDSSGVIASKPAKTKPVWLKVEVIHVDRDSMTVREVDHPMMVHTFTFGTKMAEQMEKVQANGGFQHGDKIKVQHEPGKDVALAIKGRPSKPL